MHRTRLDMQANLQGLSTHDLLVMLLRSYEPEYLRDGVLDADRLATLIEEVVARAGA